MFLAALLECLELIFEPVIYFFFLDDTRPMWTRVLRSAVLALILVSVMALLWWSWS